MKQRYENILIVWCLGLLERASRDRVTVSYYRQFSSSLLLHITLHLPAGRLGVGLSVGEVGDVGHHPVVYLTERHPPVVAAGDGLGDEVGV